MSRAIELIVGNYVRLKDRAALERMREHRSKLLQENRLRAAEGFRVETLQAALEDDVSVLDEALSRLSTALGPPE
jgi:hypothetical protein